MQICFNYVQKNYKMLVISILVSIVFLFEWAYADSFDFGKTDSPVISYGSVDSLIVSGYSVFGNEMERIDTDAYIVIPIDGDVDKLFYKFSVQQGTTIKAKTYFSIDRKGFSNKIFAENVLKNNKEISVKIPDNCTSVKIKLVGDYGKKISFGGVALSKDVLCMGRRLVVAFLVISAIVFVLFKLLTKYMNIENPIYYFAGILLVGEILFVLICFFSKNYYWGSYFCATVHNDSFMDHFNMLLLLNNDNPYYLDASYPAMCFFILKILYMFLPDSVKGIDRSSYLRDVEDAMFGFMIMIIICMCAIYLLLNKILKEDSNKALLFSLLFSGPILYMVQRGNIIIIAFVFLLVYIAYFDSDNKKKRYIAYFALALSASIKVYPALFGLMTLKKKRYKETILLVLIGFTVFILPFFAFDGVNTIKAFLHGLSSASGVMAKHGAGQNISLYNIGNVLGIFFKTEVKLSQTVLVIVTLVLLLLAFATNVEWEALFLVATACAWFPTFSFSYVLVLFIPAIIFAVKSKEYISKKDMFLLAALLIPLGLPYIPMIDRYLSTSEIILKMSFSSVIINAIIVYFVVRISLRIILELISKGTSLKHILWIDRIAVMLICCVICACFIMYNYKPYNSKYNFAGKGTERVPYEISSVDDLVYLAKLTNDGEDFAGAFFVQTKDIEFDGVTSYTPIGWSEKRKTFSGTYDGKGHSIINYYSMSDRDEDMGLFGKLNGTVCNLNLLNCNMGGEAVGGIAYEVAENGEIINCYVNGLLKGYNIGGIAAVNKGTISNCISFINSDAVNVEGIASNDEQQGRIISSFSNENTSYSMLNGNALTIINNYVNTENSKLFSDHELKLWVGDEKYFVRLEK